MKVFSFLPEAQIGETLRIQTRPGDRRLLRDRILYALYALALAVSVSHWFLAVRAPLWLDETGSFWQISSGFSQIWPRQFLSLSFPAYSYILWFSTKIIGSSELALRVPSILAMLGAVYLLYLAARELFEREIAILAAIVFCLHPIVNFAAVDVRPYACGVLAANAAILAVLRLRRSDSNWLAALFGFLAAFIVWFHLLFAVILPALVVCFFVVKIGDRKALWRQFGVALAVFALAFLPVIPGLLSLLHGAGTHVFEAAPTLKNLAGTFVPGLPWTVFGVIALVMAVLAAWVRTRTRSGWHFQLQGTKIFICLSLALIPTLILYGVSVGTSIHTFIPRHRLVAIPGIALCWAIFLSLIRPRAARLLLCVAFVATTAYVSFSSFSPGHHGYTWKYALQAAEKNASAGHAPVVICSDFPEADFAAMPVSAAKESIYFAQLSYYPLSVPVVPLPRALNGEAMRVGSQFLQAAAAKHQRFLALAHISSYATLDWLAQRAAPSYSVRTIGVYDKVELLEFVPR